MEALKEKHKNVEASGPAVDSCIALLKIHPPRKISRDSDLESDMRETIQSPSNCLQIRRFWGPLWSISDQMIFSSRRDVSSSSTDQRLKISDCDSRKRFSSSPWNDSEDLSRILPLRRRSLRRMRGWGPEPLNCHHPKQGSSFSSFYFLGCTSRPEDRPACVELPWGFCFTGNLIQS